ncbi:hypothetical protein Nepgr_002794 [Nepenthes gracilis]|uniref:Uncharacterized protein n=1 Tax=Nepenthes gracilis TaxID=150966 RepID=A0AAD3P8D9_NEPGR|nr:hypothetical protein Nepgr_002794 [Nepenthes gracilis]
MPHQQGHIGNISPCKTKQKKVGQASEGYRPRQLGQGNPKRAKHTQSITYLGITPCQQERKPVSQSVEYRHFARQPNTPPHRPRWPSAGRGAWDRFS